MCYECGCGDPNWKVSENSITEETFKKAAKGAKGMKISPTEAKRNTLELLKKQLEK